MTVSDMVDKIYELFLKAQYDSAGIQQIIQRYAKEELGLSEEEAEKYAEKTEPDMVGEIDDSDFNHFYIWYFFNYLTPFAVAPNAVGDKEAPEKASDPVERPRYPILFYAVIKIKGLVWDLPEDDAIQAWQHNCDYDLPGDEHLMITETKFLGVTYYDPIV
jgi:hypothetical protein